ncbi:Glycosyltransferase involved in cell wall bisynthesis [Butyrivibrio fibrisolvens]|uniref:Glycosyltransferase involved in cell wall bisynthesis n=1 Tax=Butyrivibrio fibrisolvens TaxID=831 RepID=A0A1H9Q459_BUTFI|nr:glycosyltransferase [Butyrivibrio fibrisolvens]SER55220.1 Glycosyltransferase involved in cell wall bisynthesis [Butyrivibrio fibrisolvens]
MKILVVVSSLSDGGAQRVASNLTLGLPSECEIDILINNAQDITYPYKGRILNLGLKLENNKGKLSYQIKVFIRRLKVLKNLKKSGGYDAVISFLDSANIANILTGNKHSRVIATVHSKLSASGFDWKYKYIVFPLVKMFYNKADQVVAVSKGIEDDLRDNLKYTGDNIITIYNGFDFEKIIESSNESLSQEEMDFISGKKVIVAVGRLCRAKGYWNLIRAFSLISSKDDKVRLLIIGDGEHRDYLHKLCKDMGLDKVVLLTGNVDNPFKYIKKSDVFVMSSLYEGLPSSLIEAMSLHVPCVATDFQSGAREILAPSLSDDFGIVDDYYEAEYGVISPICDGIEYMSSDPITKEEEILAHAIEHVLDHKDVRDRYAGISRTAVEKFEMSTMIAKYINLCSSK